MKPFIGQEGFHVIYGTITLSMTYDVISHANFASRATLANQNAQSGLTVHANSSE
jgi:hypothetical protein